MKKLFAVLVLVLTCVVTRAVDLAVPEELVGSQTLGIVHIHLKAIKFDQTIKLLTDKLGAPLDPEGVKNFKDVHEAFKAAGGQGVSILLNAGKDTDAANAADGVVFCITKSEEADNDKLKTLVNSMLDGMKVTMAKECPKEIGGALVWYSPKYKLPKANHDRASEFTDAYSHLAKDASISIVFVPDEEAVELAESQLKDGKPEDVKMVKAMLGATGICLFTDFGVAAEPAIKVLVLAADADGAVTLNKAATGLIDTIKKEAPEPLKPVLKSLATVQVGAIVQLSIGIGDIVKAVKAMSPEKPAEEK